MTHRQQLLQRLHLTQAAAKADPDNADLADEVQGLIDELAENTDDRETELDRAAVAPQEGPP